MTPQQVKISSNSHELLLEKLKSFEWPIPNQDKTSYQEIKRRIADAGRRRKLLTYSELVNGIEFRIPSLNNGKPFRLNIGGWTGQDRYIIGQFLGKLSCETYEHYGFMANAMVVDALESRPSKNFFHWMEYVAAIPSNDETDILRFWADQLQKAQKWYRRNS
jgi:hypothetical protein